MQLTKNISGALGVASLWFASAWAQAPLNQVERLDTMPIYRVTVVARTAKALNYQHRSGATKIDFRGTPLLPKARGEAKVESKQGYIEIEVEFDDLQPANNFGPEYLTYVLWAITPEGRPKNLGEVILNGHGPRLLQVRQASHGGLDREGDALLGLQWRVTGRGTVDLHLRW